MALCQDFLIWTRGSEDDYDRWANITGDNGWAFSNMMNYFKQASQYYTSYI